jgi:hypothetical protein
MRKVISPDIGEALKKRKPARWVSAPVIANGEKLYNNFKSTGCLDVKTRPLYTSFFEVKVITLNNLINFQKFRQKKTPHCKQWGG